MSIALMLPTNHLILWQPFLFLPSIFPSIRDSSNESAVHIRWPKYWSFSFSISLSNEYSELISLKIDWSDVLIVQGTFRSLLQHHSSKASILWHSAFFRVQLSQLYMTTGPYCLGYTDLCWQSDVSTYQHTVQICHSFPAKKQSSSDSWLQSPSTVILEPKKRKSVTTSTFSPSICHAVMGLDAMILDFLIFSFKLALSYSSRGSLVPLCFLPLEWYHPHIWGCLRFSCLSWFQLVIHPAWHSSWCAQGIG